MNKNLFIYPFKRIKKVLFTMLIIFTLLLAACIEGDANKNPDLSNEEPMDLEQKSNQLSETADDSEATYQEQPAATPGWNVIGSPVNTSLTSNVSVNIVGVGNYTISPSSVTTVRPDIFQPGHFSLFDCLVYLDKSGQIDMKYHLSREMNTFVIDSINGMENWNYIAVYDGQYSMENQYHRMDFYRIKDKSEVEVKQYSTSEMEKRYNIWRTEVERRIITNAGKVIVPDVRIRLKSGLTLSYTNVEVTAHNVRNDIFKDGVITGADILLSLADRGDLYTALRWATTVGTAEVKQYYLDQFDDAQAGGRCGFVHHMGEWAHQNDFSGFGGNDVHIHPDGRVIENPEYTSFYWIELGSCY